MVLAESLVTALNARPNYRATLMLTPSLKFGRSMGAAYVATWLTSVGDQADQVISLRGPSYAVR